MSDIYIADVSEFQSNVNAPAYGSGVIICRTHNGYRPDHMMPVRRDYLRAHPFTALGWYQYLAPDRDATRQAHEFLATLGGLRANEFCILDSEDENARGDQVARAEAWFRVVDRFCGFPATLYSGAGYLRSRLGSSAHWRGRPVWIASYPSNFRDDRRAEPSDAHSLWQFSDRFVFPGITGATDCSVHHGTAAEFLASARAGHIAAGPSPPRSTPAPPRQPPKPPEDTVNGPFPYTTADQRVGFVVATNSGEVKHIEQQNPAGSKDAQGQAKNSDFWRDKNGKPNWLSVGTP